MNKSFKILTALIIGLFTLSVMGSVVLAEESYNIEDGSYTIDVAALEKDSENTSAADGLLLSAADLSVQGDDITLTLGYTKNFDMDYEISWTTLEGKNSINENEDNNAEYFTFPVSEIKSVYPASMEYAVPDFPQMADGHEVEYRIVLDGLDELPVESNGADPSEGDSGDNGETEPVEDPSEGDSDDNGETEPVEDPNEGDSEENNENDNGDNGNGAVENDDNGSSNVEEDEVTNPQTGDSSNIGLYALLLVGAAIPLAIQFKRRFNS